MQICIVAGDSSFACTLERALEKTCSATTCLASGDGAADFIASQSFDAVVLDLALPGTSGFAVIEQMRRARCQTPVLVLSVCGTVTQMIRALDAGADDYMIKPCDLELFLARVRSVARRGVIPQNTNVSLGALTLCLNQREVRLRGKPLELTRREYMLLETLMRRTGQVVTRDQLATAVWGYGVDVSKGNLDYHIHSLRTKLSPVCEGMIRTVRGIGYVLGSARWHSDERFECSL